MKRPEKKFQHGMTLIEISVVLLILVALAGLAVPYVGSTGRTAMCQATDATMQAVKEAIMGGVAGPGYYADRLGNYPAKPGVSSEYDLHYLFSYYEKDDPANCNPDPSNSGCAKHNHYNPNTGVGWRGPYLMSGATNSFPVDGRAGDDGTGGTDGAGDNTDLTNELHTHFDDTTDYVHSSILINDQVVLDGWGRPIILQVPTTGTDCPGFPSNPERCARLVSAGPIPGRDIQSNGFTVKRNDMDAYEEIPPGSNEFTRGDDRVLYLGIPDPGHPTTHEGNIPCDQL